MTLNYLNELLIIYLEVSNLIDNIWIILNILNEYIIELFMILLMILEFSDSWISIIKLINIISLNDNWISDRYISNEKQYQITRFISKKQRSHELKIFTIHDFDEKLSLNINSMLTGYQEEYHQDTLFAWNMSKTFSISSSSIYHHLRFQEFDSIEASENNVTEFVREYFVYSFILKKINISDL